MAQGETVVYIVDDDELLLKAVGRLVWSAGFTAKTYSKPEMFVSEFDPEADACIVLDITMPGMSGLQLHAQLNARVIDTPVISFRRVTMKTLGYARGSRALDASCVSL